MRLAIPLAEPLVVGVVFWFAFVSSECVNPSVLSLLPQTHPYADWSNRGNTYNHFTESQMIKVFDGSALLGGAL